MEIKTLSREIELLKSGDISRLAESYNKLKKELGQERFFGSALTIEIKTINNNEKSNILIEETQIIDGISDETIQAIMKDIARSYKHRLQFNQIKEA